MSKRQGRLELTWTDKDKTLLSSGDGRYDYSFVDPSDYRVSEVRLLHEVERVEAETPSARADELPVPTADNLLITGDAMHVLDALTKTPEYAEKYAGKVKLVYIDPPFNTGQAFANYEDNIEHSIWLTMLRDRLRQIKPLLSEGSSVWVHLDDVEVHRCRVVMDEEFGAPNFVAAITWEKLYARKSNNRGFSPNHDTLVVYGVGPKAQVGQLPSTDELLGRYKNPDDDARGPWQSVAFSVRTDDPARRTEYRYEVELPSGRKVGPPPGRHWNGKRERYERLLVDNLIWFGADGDSRPRYKHFVNLDEVGLVPQTIWPRSEVGDNDSAKKDLKRLFPERSDVFDTPKPERLLERIIHLATEPGDIVLDCFAGSGTTAAVAHKMGRRWVTSELIPETADTFTKPRLTKVVHGEDSGGITTSTQRVAVKDSALPEGMSATEAQEFTRLLNKVAKAEGVDVDKAALKALRDATKSKDLTTTLWHGGGGFIHLRVGPSMFVELDGMILLADWATQGELSRAMCSQLSVRYRPDGIFAGKRGRTRYVVLDGMVGESTVASIVDRLEEAEIVEVWATQIDDGAAEALRTARPGSRLDPIPDAVLDNYRRKSAKKSPFGGDAKSDSGDA